MNQRKKILPIEKRFIPVSRSPVWQKISEKDWNSWVWQQQRRIKTIEDLEKILPLNDSDRNAFEKTKDRFRMAITPYYASLIDPDDPNCPIRLQSVPQEKEMIHREGELEDPLAEEEYLKAPGLTHRYPDRALLYTTHNCPVYCRHCTRKRKVSDPSSAVSPSDLKLAFEYLERTPEIRDVLVSGGDPLSNSDSRLEFILNHLRKIESIEIIRLATRNLVTLPQRFTDQLVSMMKKYQPLYIHTHFNHPKECTREAYDTAIRLADSGFAVYNQMVLLKGINDQPEIVRDLNHRLLQMRIRPYYIFQCDMAQGVGHFRTPIEKGLKIIEALRGWTSGMAVPHFAVDLPKGGGKIALTPNYVERREGRKWYFRNYKGEPFEYQEPSD